jgi:rhodanese-related sulfurtransferase
MAKKQTSSRKTQNNRKPKRAADQFKFWWVIAAVLILALGGFWIAGKFNQPTGVASLPPEITVSEAYQKYEQGVVLLDVRTPEEWNEFHAPNTTLIPLDQLAARVNELPQDQEIVIVCRSGNRSQQGRDILLQAGFEQVTSMQGGLNEWRAVGYPVVSGP